MAWQLYDSGKHRTSFVPPLSLHVTISSDTSPVPTTVRLNFQTSAESQSHWFLSPVSTVHEPYVSRERMGAGIRLFDIRPRFARNSAAETGFRPGFKSNPELHNVDNSGPASFRAGLWFRAAESKRMERVSSLVDAAVPKGSDSTRWWARATLFVLEIDFLPRARTLHGEILATNPSDYGSVNPTNGLLHRFERNCTWMNVCNIRLSRFFFFYKLWFFL